MNLNFQKKSLEDWLEVIALAGIVLLFTGFFFNRVVNNIGSGLIAFYTIIKLREHKKILKHPWIISIMLISVIPFLSDILLEGIYFYQHRGDLKLLLLVYPLFIFCLKPTQAYIEKFMFGFIILMVISSCYSLFLYFRDYDSMFMTYKESRVVKTLAKGDHIRISWATVISCLMAVYLVLKNKKRMFVLGIYIVFQVFFLHILGSKTGLITLYLSAGIFLLIRLNKLNTWLAGGFILMFATLPIIAYKTIPSFEQRMNFIKYDFEHYSQGKYREGLSDAIRFYSLLAGKDIIAEHPYFGCGFSRLEEKTFEWFRTTMPEIGQENYFVPSSQIVIYWASGGIICLMIFLYHLFYPFFDLKLRSNIWFMIFFIPAALSFVYETHLEGQFSLFFYGFFMSFFWYLAYSESEITMT